ncbi:glycosyltransferase family 39 protein [Sphingobium sp. HBC34]|uniref:Glycosyltransferase family 39 protein n=1 Tax=Sphingobium cyanobacteriorum TaxID=3063954 RepID=A0ABT8ZNV0_9SPHN|nr:glycosyltransferase family 39 protein [Sphingobium sp. HBC34]MDO7836103.1 glycosyltransferase family 39 protein [Sphingobium sp. HBC34]
MYRQFVLAPTRSRAAPVALMVALALTLWFGLTAIATPFDHDESQYVAGAYFSSHLLIFRDFLYLQPPLHAWTYAPLAWIFPGDMVLAMRLATATTALCTLLTLWTAQRIAGISRDSAAIATLLVAATAAFQFTGSVVRNDMLPTLLSAGGLLVSLLALRHCTPRFWCAAGSLFGLAIATKLNFAPLGLMTGLFVISAGGRCGLRAACWLAAGAAVGMVPMLLGWMLSPGAFLYGVFTYGATAPHAWYAANGAFGELDGVEKLTDLLKYLWKGPALTALVLLAANWIATRRRVRSPGRRLAIWMTGGALIGAALPTPSQVQYLMPLLPPLALALGYLLDDARHWAFAPRQALLGLLCLAAIPGMLTATRHVEAMLREGSPVLKAGAAARWAGRTVRVMTGDDDVATLSPHMILGSGLRLDPRFAPGPFAWRTGWTMGAPLARRVHAMIPATLPDLDRDPPAAILTGYEAGTRKLPLRPDDALDAYARQHGYRMMAMPDGVGRLYVRHYQPD